MRKLITLIIIMTSCINEVKQNSYEINGITKKIPDSTVITISANNKIIDSTIVIEEKFQLKGKVIEPTKVVLKVKNSKDYKSFWLENNKISFTSEKGKFIDSEITGSETQKEADLIDEIIKPLRKRRYSLVTFLNDETLNKTYKDSILILFNKTYDEESEAYKAFVKKNPNSIVSSQVLNKFKTNWGKKITSELLSLMNKERQESENGKAIIHFLKLNKNLQIGDKYVDFQQENTNGQKIKLSNIKGKYILLEFWASWCYPCRMSNPALVEEYNRYNKQGFEIISISLDEDKKSWLKAIKKDKLTWENVSDLKGTENEVGLIYGIKEIPDNILIDPNGIIIGRTLKGKKLKEKLEEIFVEKASL